MSKSDNSTEGMVEVFCRYIKRDGKTIFPKSGKYFHFFVKPKTA